MPPAPPSLRTVEAAPLRFLWLALTRERFKSESSGEPDDTLVAPGTAFGTGVGS